MDLNKYELTFILKPDLPPEVNDQIIDRFRDIIKQEGDMVKIDVWGKKKLAYTIDKSTKGLYVNFLFESPPAHIREIERNLKNHQDVVRYLTIRLDDRTDFVTIRAREEEKRARREAERAAAADAAAAGPRYEIPEEQEERPDERPPEIVEDDRDEGSVDEEVEIGEEVEEK